MVSVLISVPFNSCRVCNTHTPAAVDGLVGFSQGGAVVDPYFAGHPWHSDALRLRRYDDAAKDPAAPGAPVQMVLDLAQRLAR